MRRALLSETGGLQFGLVRGHHVGPGAPEAAGGAAAAAEGGRLPERGGAAGPAALLHCRVLPVAPQEGEAHQRLPGLG